MDRVVDKIIAPIFGDLSDHFEAWKPSETASTADYEAVAEIFVRPFFETILFCHAYGAGVVMDEIRPALFADKATPAAAASYLTTREAIREAVKRAAYAADEWDEIIDTIAEMSCKLAAYTSMKVYESVIESIGAAIAEGATISEWAQTSPLENLGILKQNPYYLENVFRTNSSTYYAAGKWSALQKPAAKKAVAALEFIAVLDSRTTPLCDRLSGTIAAVDDPIWDKFYPPNHYMCRSTVGFVSAFEDWTSQYPPNDIDPPDPGWDRNVGKEWGTLPEDVRSKLENSAVSPWMENRIEGLRSEIRESRK